jgi:hypothetical protein
VLFIVAALLFPRTEAQNRGHHMLKVGRNYDRG